MEIRISGNQLLVLQEDLGFFQRIKEDEISLNIKINDNLSKDVLRNKKIDKQCPDITKIAPLKENMESCLSKILTIKNITIELECSE